MTAQLDQLVLWHTPSFVAVPAADGGWHLHAGWGGSRQVLARLADDAALLAFIRLNYDTARDQLLPLFARPQPKLDPLELDINMENLK